MTDDKRYDKELQDYFKELEHNPKKYALFKTYVAMASAYYPDWLPPRLDRDIWKRTVRETVLRIMMAQEYELARKLQEEALREGRYYPTPTRSCIHLCHMCECR